MDWKHALANAPSQKGWKARTAAAAAIRAQEEARRADPRVLAIAATRRAANDEHRLKGVVGAAEDKRDELLAKLDAAKARLGRLDDLEYATGSISDEARTVRAQVAGLPRLIERAEIDLAAARDALAAQKATMAHLMEPASEPEPVQTAAPAAATVKKGKRS